MSVSEIEVELFGGRRATARPRAATFRRPERVGVVGAGIVGCSIAWHLARAGAEVVIFEKRRPASGATSDSFAWINATFDKRPRSYFDLNVLGMLGYQELEAELKSLRVEWSGSVQWHAPVDVSLVDVGSSFNQKLHNFVMAQKRCRREHGRIPIGTDCIDVEFGIVKEFRHRLRVSFVNGLPHAADASRFAETR